MSDNQVQTQASNEADQANANQANADQTNNGQENNNQVPEPVRPEPGQAAKILRELAEADKREREARQSQNHNQSKLQKYEELLRLAANDPETFLAITGKKAPAQVQKEPDLKDEVFSLKKKLEEKEKREQEALLQQQIGNAEKEVINYVREKKDQFVLTTALNMEAAVFDRLKLSYNQGQELSEYEAASEIEAALLKQVETLAKVPAVIELFNKIQKQGSDIGSQTQTKSSNGGTSTAKETEPENEVSKIVKSIKPVKRTLTSKMNGSAPTEKNEVPKKKSKQEVIKELVQKYQGQSQ